VHAHENVPGRTLLVQLVILLQLFAFLLVVQSFQKQGTIGRSRELASQGKRKTEVEISEEEKV
jgi:hypothetical protein